MNQFVTVSEPIFFTFPHFKEFKPGEEKLKVSHLNRVKLEVSSFPGKDVSSRLFFLVCQVVFDLMKTFSIKAFTCFSVVLVAPSHLTERHVFNGKEKLLSRMSSGRLLWSQF